MKIVLKKTHCDSVLQLFVFWAKKKNRTFSVAHTKKNFFCRSRERVKAKNKMFFENSTSRPDKNSTAYKIFHKHNLCLHYSNAKNLNKKSHLNKKLHDF